MIQRVLDRPLTLEEFLARSDDEPFEVVDGQPVESAAPSGPHQRWVRNVLVQLMAEYPDHEVLPGPIDWVLRIDPLLVREPDIVVVSPEQGDLPRLSEPPLLAVEVLSPDSFERDVITKRREYAEAGLSRYWIVDPDNGEIRKYRLRDGRLVEE